MTLEELLALSPTLSEYDSNQLIAEILVTKDDWRCYSDDVNNVEELVERYLKNHAKNVGFISEEIYASEPAQVFFFVDSEGNECKGGLFKNGAVMQVKKLDGKKLLTLFIQESTALRWFYPEEGYHIMSKEIRESS